MPVMDSHNIKRMTTIFHMLSNPNRLQVLSLCQEEAISVGHLADRLQLSQSLVSHHLKQLRDADLITATRQGKNRLYHIQDKRVRCILKDMLVHAARDLNKGSNG